MKSDRDNSATKRPTQNGLDRRTILLSGASLFAVAAVGSNAAQAAEQPNPPAVPSGSKPNLVVIFGDDIGQSNISAYTFGLMGYRTPNIDRIAGRHDVHRLLCRDSCTAGRSFHHRADAATHRPFQGRLPARPLACSQRHHHCGGAEAARLCDRTIRQEPSRRPQRVSSELHGFDEFFGNLYHLNAEEEPEDPDCPNDPAFEAMFGRAACSSARRATPTTRRRTRALARSASRRSKIPGR